MVTTVAKVKIKKPSHTLQEIAIEDTIHTLDLDLSCRERYVRKQTGGGFAFPRGNEVAPRITIFTLEFIARTSYHDIDRCVFVFAKISTGYIS